MISIQVLVTSEHQLKSMGSKYWLGNSRSRYSSKRKSSIQSKIYHRYEPSRCRSGSLNQTAILPFIIKNGIFCTTAMLPTKRERFSGYLRHWRAEIWKSVWNLHVPFSGKHISLCFNILQEGRATSEPLSKVFDTYQWRTHHRRATHCTICKTNHYKKTPHQSLTASYSDYPNNQNKKVSNVTCK